MDQEKCTGCGACVRDCPVGAIRMKRKKAQVGDSCTFCGACVRICAEGALWMDEIPPPEAVQCESCPIGCWVKEGYTGACQRYHNEGGRLARVTPLHFFNDVQEAVGPQLKEAIRRPLVTGIGAGTTYPDCRPAPLIVQGKREDVDVVTVVTEAPLSYSSVLVKLDTDIPVGDEGAAVLVGKRSVGMVITEQYGSKMLSIGGVNLLTGNDGLLVARTMTDIANRKPVNLRVQGGSRLEIEVGKAPLINGLAAASMRVGCGSATLGLFAPILEQCADEVIVLDSHLTGLMSEHAAGRFVGVRASGVRLRFKQSTPGRYFGDHGHGWGGTSIVDPLEVIDSVASEVARVGMHLLITETTGQHASMYELGADWNFREVPLTVEAKRAVEAISSSCEPGLVSALYLGGAGGSARAGVTRFPIELTRAVHENRASLTVGGAPTFVLPGGGITFMVDVQRVKANFFYWTPAPAIICPIEYTMELEDYEKMGGHLEAMKPFTAVQPLLNGGT